MDQEQDGTPFDGAARGGAVIAAFARTLPPAPGVYRMLDGAGAPLYVGKAKNLKKRVASYTQPERQSLRILRMIALTRSMEFAVTHTEAEALLLEANLIKQLKPRYNILLRDDKSFPHIAITAHDFPQVVKHRGAREAGVEYFGPFASGAAVHETLAVLQRVFQLRNCPDSVFAQRTRPCLQYQIKRCTAPCVGKVTAVQYAAQVAQARDFLSGRSRGLQEEMAARMQAASEALDFETAAALRDRIRALTRVQAATLPGIGPGEDADVFALAVQDGQSCVQVFFVRGGQNFGNRAYFPRHDAEEGEAEILSAFIAQFYAARPAPPEVLVSHAMPEADLLAEALRARGGRKVEVSCPSRGPRRALTEMALENARRALAHKRAADADHAVLMERLAEIFGLSAPPERIEVYDNSHLSGTHAVGAMIVAGPEGFVKAAYRKFNMRDAAGGDDFAMMRETLGRRFGALARGEGGQRPDLVIVDGGAGQLSAARAAMDEAGAADVPLAAMAKGPDRNAGRERFFLPGREPLDLPPGDPLLHFLQRARDEAHRFVITAHRARRSKAIGQSPLDEIPGVGARRKKALLAHFGSAKAVAEAGVPDLEKVDGVSTALARAIYGFFHQDA